VSTRRTWWVKLRRAEKHLAEFKGEFDRLRDTDHPYDVVPGVQTDEHGSFLIVRGHLLPFAGDDELAAVVGDVVANTRDSLDHIETALTGSDEAHFPILRDDIWKRDIDPSTRRDRNKSRRDRFKKDTHGMPGGAFTLIKGLQPYVRHPQFPETDPLAVLRRFSNADKHRTLHVVSGMLYHPTTTITINGYEPFSVPSERTGMDGAVIATVPWWSTDVDFEVEASGGIEVTLKEAGGPPGQYWVLPDILSTTIRYVRNIVKSLDKFVP